MLRFSKPLLSLTALTIALVVVPVTIAQEETAPANETVVDQSSPEAESVILQKKGLKKEIETVRQTYRGYLEEHRRRDKAFRIAQDQYFNLQTLVSLEEAVRSTKAVMESRSQVLLTYLSLLKLKLIEADGIELSVKTKTVNRIEAFRDEFIKHIDLVGQAKDRNDVDQLALEFAIISDGVEDVSHQALALLVVGQLQNIYDKAAVIHQELQAKDIRDGRSISAEKRRAYDEADRVLQKTQANLIGIWDEIISAAEKGNLNSFYNDKARRLNPAYVSLSRSVSYLEELLEL